MRDALIGAVRDNNTDVLRTLLAQCPQGATETRDPHTGATLIGIAARDGCVEAVEWLILLSANPEAVTRTGVSPLAASTARGHLDVVHALAPFVEIDRRGTRGATALYGAAFNGHLRVVMTLIEDYGADPLIRMTSNTTPLLVAAAEGHPLVVAYLAKLYPTVDVMDEKGATPLFAACRYGHTGCIQILIKHGANIEHRTHRGMTSVLIACRYGHLGIVKLLVRRYGADLDAVTKAGMTALAAACEGGFLDTVTYLVNRGADVEAMDNHYGTPLMHAARGGHYTVVKYLIDVGRVQIDRQLKFGMTAIGAATMQQTLENASEQRMANARRTAEVLAIRGVRPNALDTLAAHNDFRPFLRVAAIGDPLQIAVCCRLEDEIKWILSTRTTEIDVQQHVFYKHAKWIPSPWNIKLELYGSLGKRVAKLALQAIQPWWPTRHHLYHRGVRTAIRTVMLCAQRPLPTLPHCPTEMWFMILTFVRRSWFQ